MVETIVLCSIYIRDRLPEEGRTHLMYVLIGEIFLNLRLKVEEITWFDGCIFISGVNRLNEGRYQKELRMVTAPPISLPSYNPAFWLIDFRIY